MVKIARIESIDLRGEDREKEFSMVGEFNVLFCTVTDDADYIE